MKVTLLDKPTSPTQPALAMLVLWVSLYSLFASLIGVVITPAAARKYRE